MLYPTRNGLIIPPPELGYETVEPKRGLTNNHHGYWPRAEYVDDPVRRVMRALIDNVCTLVIPDHLDLHSDFSPPRIPKAVVMIDAVNQHLETNGSITLVREKKTSETYVLEPERWACIVKHYKI